MIVSIGGKWGTWRPQPKVINFNKLKRAALQLSQLKRGCTIFSMMTLPNVAIVDNEPDDDDDCDDKLPFCL